MSTTPSIKTCLWYDHDGHDAARAYCDIVPDSEITDIMPGGPEIPGTGEHAPLVVEFRLGSQQYVALNGGPMFPHTEAASIMLYVDGQDELDRVWDALLADGGETSQCGWLKDRFGLSWQVIPTRYNELVSDPDPAVVQRVVQQMLTMTKLDIAPLEAAATDA